MTTERQVRKHMINEFSMLPDKVDEMLKRHSAFVAERLEQDSFTYHIASQLVMVEEDYLEVSILPDTYYSKEE